MATTRKTLAQAALAATTLTDVYTVPVSTSTVVSTITVCNRDSVAATIRLSVAIAGAADSTKQYLIYGTTCPGNETIWITIGATLAATDVLRAWASAATVSVNVFGEETL